MLSGTPTGQFQGVPTWSRTRTKTLGGSRAIRYTIGTQSRRLDLHQHDPVYKTGASLFGHVGFLVPIGAVVSMVGFLGRRRPLPRSEHRKARV